MEMSPHQVRTASFKSSRKGFDPDEVATFLQRVAEALESAQNHSTAMEARARAAVARLQEATAAAESSSSNVTVDVDQAETISRTLLLAQRTADTAIAEARTEADRILEAARTEAASTLDSTRDMSAKLLEEARAEARELEGVERERMRSEVEALLARREFLHADVEQLEQFLVEQRERMRAAAASLIDLTERIPGGLGHVHAPLLSAVTAVDDAAPVDEEQDDDEALFDERDVEEQDVEEQVVDELVVIASDDPTPTSEDQQLRFDGAAVERSDTPTGNL
jgi:DivIVA domain-containing protein